MPLRRSSRARPACRSRPSARCRGRRRAGGALGHADDGRRCPGIGHEDIAPDARSHGANRGDVGELEASATGIVAGRPPTRRCTSDIGDRERARDRPPHATQTSRRALPRRARRRTRDLRRAPATWPAFARAMPMRVAEEREGRRASLAHRTRRAPYGDGRGHRATRGIGIGQCGAVLESGVQAPRIDGNRSHRAPPEMREIVDGTSRRDGVESWPVRRARGTPRRGIDPDGSDGRRATSSRSSDPYSTSRGRPSHEPSPKAMKSFVMRKSATRIADRDDDHGARGARPDPSVPPVVRSPKWQPMIAMRKPKPGSSRGRSTNRSTRRSRATSG